MTLEIHRLRRRRRSSGGAAVRAFRDAYGGLLDVTGMVTYRRAVRAIPPQPEPNPFAEAARILKFAHERTLAAPER